MARPARRLIRILAATFAALLLLALLGVAALFLFVDADTFRPFIERAASDALGRPVSLGRLHWQLGRRVGLRSEGGAVANAPGFDAPQWVSWRSVDFGVALWPLVRQRDVRVDHLSVQGLALDLQRLGDGSANWEFALLSLGGDVGQGAGDAVSSAQPWRFALDTLELSDAAVRFRDEVSGRDVAVSALNLSLRLPEDLTASTLRFEDIALAARVQDWPVRFQADAVDVALADAAVDLPAFEAQFDETSVSGALQVGAGESLSVDARLNGAVPSVRRQLERLGLPLSPMRDADVPGAATVAAHVRLADGAAHVDDLVLHVDDTTLQGTVELPSLDPFSLRFDLDADRLRLDRYLSPTSAPSEPFELPVSMLRSLDAKGTLRVGELEASGAMARSSVITVE
ncbi:MAG: AsmA family protein [Nevskiaceae bacterium]|jgi:AsmA protein|nr:AsmA family protein [Nevskiaceae bacterium]